MPRFVHLHGHTQYSLLDGLSKIPQLVKKVKDLGMEAVAITDHGVMYGAIEFYKACKEADIKPIIGVEMYIAKRSHKDKEGKLDSEPFHLTVLAKNYQGYLNLMKLTSIAHIEGYYYRPRVDKQLLRQYSEGLIALSGCPSGELIRSIEDNVSKSEQVISSYLDIFGEGNFFLELQNHPYQQSLESATDEMVRKDLQRLVELQNLTKERITELSQKMGVAVVATNDFHYINKEDAEAQDVLLCVQTGKLLSETARLRMIDTPDYFVKSADEMAEDFKDLPQALENTAKISHMVNLEIPLGVARFPVFKSQTHSSSMEYLRQLTYKLPRTESPRFSLKSLQEQQKTLTHDSTYPRKTVIASSIHPRHKMAGFSASDYKRAQEKIKLTKDIKERLDYELGVIEKTKYADYFLVVADFMEWAHSRGIITNTRGSAAGSMVLFVLGVTNLNPLDYLLPFERFLTIYRPTLPDIDVDIADDRRDEVIDYVMKKYGQDRVAHIVTFGTMMGRAAIRDVGRVMGLSYGDVDRIAKLVPPPHQGFHKSLQEAIREVPDLAQMYKNDPQVKKLLDLAIKLEGTVRHASVHAAGIVIAPEEITNFTPLQKESAGEKLVSQYDMFAVEDAGLVKMDLLGIRNLSILGKAIEIVYENQEQRIDLDKIPLDDKRAFELLARGDTMGIFQLSSAGMTRYLVELKPSSVADLAAMVALYRPGPLGVIPEYIHRKNNPKLIKYLDPRMKEYMEQSLGLLVYQEDVLFTAINLAGYSWEEADKFRKAMGKKNPSEMAKQKGKFVEGCIKNGMRRDKAEQVFALIAPFAAYGFNKSHAASYAVVAYQTAYMKANFPVEFMAAVMTAESGDADKIAAAIEECKNLGIVVSPPDINKSGIGFTLESLKSLSEEDLERSLSGEIKKSVKQGIRFGLSAIKNVGVSAIESIIRGRELQSTSILKAREKGEFVSLFDLCLRVDTRLVNRKTLESLIKAGALDNLGSRTAQLLILDQVLEEAHKISRNRLSGQVSLFDSEDTLSSLAISLPEVDELPLEQLLMFEKDLLGFYLHEPPFLKLLQQITQFVSVKISDVTDEHIGKNFCLGGVITHAKNVVTKKSGREMAFIRISDGVAEIEAVVFPATFEISKNFLHKDEVVLTVGRIDKREEELSLVIDKLTVFDPENIPDEFLQEKEGKSVEIYVPKGTQVTILQSVNKTLRTYPGKIPVTLLLPNGLSELRRMDLPFSISPNQALQDEIKNLLGSDAFKIV